jgi:hypothetical protein
LYRSEAREDSVLVAVDPATRAARPLQAWTGTHRDRSGLSAVAGERFYDLRESLLPSDADHLRAGLKLSGLTVTDVRSGSVRPVPLLSAGPLRTTADKAGDQGRWLGAGGGRLFLATQATSGSNPSEPPVVTSFDVRDPKQPVELGGVPPGAWPDPCRLLAGVPNDPALGPPAGRPVADEPLALGGARIPATSCTHNAGDVHNPADRTGFASVRVLWVAATRNALTDPAAWSYGSGVGSSPCRRPEPASTGTVSTARSSRICAHLGERSLGIHPRRLGSAWYGRN